MLPTPAWIWRTSTLTIKSLLNRAFNSLPFWSFPRLEIRTNMLWSTKEQLEGWIREIVSHFKTPTASQRRQYPRWRVRTLFPKSWARWMKEWVGRLKPRGSLKIYRGWQLLLKLWPRRFSKNHFLKKWRVTRTVNFWCKCKLSTSCIIETTSRALVRPPAVG